MTIPTPEGAVRTGVGTDMDILVTRSGRTLPMLGAVGAKRELAFLPFPAEILEQGEACPPQHTPLQAPPTQLYTSPPFLPVLIGAGTGVALRALVYHLTTTYGPGTPLAIVDKEEDILAASALQAEFANIPITWITAKDSQNALLILTKLQFEHQHLPLQAYVNPFYMRLDREFYAAIAKACDASKRINFWERTRYPRFAAPLPRILLLTSKYFLMGEIISACERLEIPHYLLQVPDGEVGQTEFIEAFLSSVLEFKPDFVFTINHLGVDREGILTNLLEKLQLPLASWFVDNPHLILHLYSRLVSPWATLFTWDEDNLPSLTDLGFAHTRYLPLGVDIARFSPRLCSMRSTPPPNRPGQPATSWRADVSFVGNSMVSKVFHRMEKSALPPPLFAGYQKVAAGFSASNERSIRHYFRDNHPELLPFFDSFETTEQQLAYEAMLTWEATRQYRLSCVEATLPFAPLIVGDKGWLELLAEKDPWSYHPELNYYQDLPNFYPCSAINFNCTSKQMKGAVNQRVFDVPACEAFLLTDYRIQIEHLFEPGKEVVCYHSPEEATDLIRYYLNNPDKRTIIAQAARKRILAEHSYEHRLQTLAAHMRAIYGSS